MADRVAPYSREAGCNQDAVASPPMRCPADAVFLASAMKLRAAKNSETQVVEIILGLLQNKRRPERNAPCIFRLQYRRGGSTNKDQSE
jgi:hypothetical protein